MPLAGLEDTALWTPAKHFETGQNKGSGTGWQDMLCSTAGQTASGRVVVVGEAVAVSSLPSRESFTGGTVLLEVVWGLWDALCCGRLGLVFTGLRVCREASKDPTTALAGTDGCAVLKGAVQDTLL